MKLLFGNDRMEWFVQICEGGLGILLLNELSFHWTCLGNNCFWVVNFTYGFALSSQHKKPLDNNKGYSFIAIEVQPLWWLRCWLQLDAFKWMLEIALHQNNPSPRKLDVISPLQENFPWEIDSSTLGLLTSTRHPSSS